MPQPIWNMILKKVSEADSDLYSSIVKSILYAKADSIYKDIHEFLGEPQGKRILDIGTGIGGINSFLRSKGYLVTGVDVTDLTLIKEATPQIYDGEMLPFKDKEYDCAVIIHVLHHCADNLGVLKEALRVSKRVIVIEDTYRNALEWGVVSLNDMLGNWEFKEHPYLTTAQWVQVFKENHWNLVSLKEFSSFNYYAQYGRYVLFVLES